MDRRYHEVDVRRIVGDMVEQDLFACDAHVMFAGGEPSIWGRFDDVLATLLSHGVRFLVCTNGVRYMPALEAVWDPAGRLEVICGVLSAGRPLPVMSNYNTTAGPE
jgi:organic radical activating enzyme